MLSCTLKSLARAPKPERMLELARYGVCSGVALGVDVSLFAIVMAVGMPYLWAATIGFSAGLCTAYWISTRWVFLERALTDRRAEFAVFCLIGVAGLVLTNIGLWLLVERLSFGPLVAKLCVAGFIFLFNFTLRKAMLFTAAFSGREGKSEIIRTDIRSVVGRG